MKRFINFHYHRRHRHHHPHHHHNHNKNKHCYHDLINFIVLVLQPGSSLDRPMTQSILLAAFFWAIFIPSGLHLLWFLDKSCFTV